MLYDEIGQKNEKIQDFVSNHLPLFYSTDSLQDVIEHKVNPSYTTGSGFNEQARHHRDMDGSYVQYLMHVRHEEDKWKYAVEAFNCFPKANGYDGLVVQCANNKRGRLFDRQLASLDVEVKIWKSENDGTTDAHISMLAFYVDEDPKNFPPCEWKSMAAG